MQTDSAIYQGTVRHRRLLPHQHQFSYTLMQWYFALDELKSVNMISRLLSTSAAWAPFHFKEKDYLRDEWHSFESLNDAVLNKIRQLGSAELDGKIFFLGNVRCWGLYFSPLNCFFLQNHQGQFTHMLAEVSNTPWNQRHYYLVDLALQADTEKAFHVSPFNPMDMVYHWTVHPPQEAYFLRLEASVKTEQGTAQTHFMADMQLNRIALTQQSVKQAMWRHPWMTIKTISGIYWQAIRLFIRRTPFYSNPTRSD